MLPMLEALSVSWNYEIRPGDKYRVQLKILDLEQKGRDFEAADFVDIELGVAALFLLRKQWDLPIELRMTQGTNYNKWEEQTASGVKFQRFFNVEVKKMFQRYFDGDKSGYTKKETSLLKRAEQYLLDSNFQQAAQRALSQSQAH